MDLTVQIIISLCIIGGALLYLAAGVALHRSRDGVTRINMQGTAIGFGTPVFMVGIFLEQTRTSGLDWGDLIKLGIITVAVMAVASVGSMMLGRSAIQARSPMDPRTRIDIGRVASVGSTESTTDSSHEHDSTH